MFAFWRKSMEPRLFAEPRVTVERRPDGSIILRNPVAQPSAARAIGVWLERWAREAPARTFFAERPTPGAPWRILTYADAMEQVRAVASALLTRGLSADRPVAILSDNAAAALPQSVWEALEALSVEFTGKKTPMVSSWGSTETAPLATDCHFQAERSGNIGLPVPGVELKLVPNGDKREILVRGPNVTPGYWKNEALTREAFDAEGFYRIGDAVRFADPARPEAGLFFDGRVSEDFKLTSGTWVSVGELRVDGISALAPVAQDIVVTGHDQDDVGFLVFPNVAACRRIAGAGDAVPVRDVLDHPIVREAVRSGVTQLKARGGGSSRYAAGARLLDTPPSVDHGEITDKAYINQRAVLSRREAEVKRLHGDDPAHYIAAG